MDKRKNKFYSTAVRNMSVPWEILIAIIMLTNKNKIFVVELLSYAYYTRITM